MDLVELIALQEGVVSRRQLVDLGKTANDIRRMLRRRELVRVHPGVYVNHTGPLTPSQLEWVAVLACWPAALAHDSVLSPANDGVVHVAIDVRRTVVPPRGVVVHRLAHLDDRVRWNCSPPTVRVEHAAIVVALRQPDASAMFRVLSDTIQSRRTTVDKITEALGSWPPSAGRTLLSELLDDLAQGACSVLERGYLLLERGHGLPTGRPDVTRQRQRAGGAKSHYSDVRYEPFGLVVELDGRAFHDNAKARDKDAARDLDIAVAADDQTVRLTHGQVFRDGCLTIRKVGSLLQRRGWTGMPTRCPDCM